MPITTSKSSVRVVRSLMRAGAAAGLVMALAAGCAPSPSELEQGAPSTPSATPSQCAELSGKVVGGVSITSAKHVDRDEKGISAGFCQVSGHRAPLLDIEVDLPDDWSGRLYQQGGGGFNGRINSAVLRDQSGGVEYLHPALTTHGAIYAASNGGNRADVPGEAAPQVWLTGDDDAQASLRNYAFGSLWTTMRFAKGLSQEYYGSAPKRSYFNGCSNGGARR